MELYGESKVAETVNIQNNSGNDNITDNNVINNNDKKNNHNNELKDNELTGNELIENAIEALQKYGPLKGSFLAIKRILRCNHFSKGGYDPVP